MGFIVTQSLYIDLINGGIEVVPVGQNDNNARQLACYIQADGIDWEVPEGTTVNIQVMKPNGNGIYREVGKDGFGTVNGNIVTMYCIWKGCKGEKGLLFKKIHLLPEKVYEWKNR